MTEIETVRAFLAQLRPADDSAPTLDEQRASYDEAGGNMPMADGVAVEEVSLGGVAGLKFTPANAVGERTVLYFHGGGYMIGSPRSHRALTSHIAVAAKARVYSMDYRMAPEVVFPGAVEDGVAAYKALLEAGIPPEQIVISGDSAGGGLTVATALKARDSGLPQPAGLAPISPWVNLGNQGWSYQEKAASDPMVTYDGLTEMATGYAGGADRSDPLISPVQADLSGLAPMLIHVGAEEVLLSDSVSLAERAGAAGVTVNLKIWPEMIHVFHFFHAFLSDGRQAIAELGGFVEAQTSRQPQQAAA